MSTNQPIYEALAELVRRYEQPDNRTPDPNQALTRYEFSVFSQNGEDGVVAELRHRVGVTNRWFVEFGIQSGVEGNCVFLADVLGWSGLFIEPHDDAYNELRRKYSGNRVVETQHALVTPDNVERLFANAGVPQQPDILSIDVDGNDYWIWQALKSYSPRVVVIEYNSHWPFASRWVQPYDPDRIWQGTDNYGASLGALRSLADEKGYRLVHTELSGNNAFFVCKNVDGIWPIQEIVPLRAPNHFLRGASHPAHQDHPPQIIDLDKAL